MPTGSTAPSRRAVLTGISGLFLATAATTLLPLGSALAHGTGEASRALAFRHLHTGEELEVAYWAEGRYQALALRRIDLLMRDWRNGEIARIDRNLLDILYRLRKAVDSDAPFEVVSGYRSPATNAMLRKRSKGVAKKSLHMRGMAIDLSLPDRRLSELRRAALDLRAGGVGYYPNPGFIHVDTGRVRSWG